MRDSKDMLDTAADRPNRQLARDLHFSSIIADTHNDVVVRLLNLGHDLRQKLGNGFVDLPSMKEGNFTAQFFAFQVPHKHYARGDAKEQLKRMMAAVIGFCEENADQIALARTSADIRALAAEGRQAAVLCIEGAHVIGEDLASLQVLHDQGIRYITPAHFYTSSWSDSSTDNAAHGGLSPLGVEAIKEMNRIGIVVDAAHISDEAFWQVLEITSRPVMVSHAGARALLPHPRNITDEMIAAVGKMRGLIGVCPYPEFLTHDFYRAIERKALEVSSEEEIRRTIPSAILMAHAQDNPEASYNIISNLGIELPTIWDYIDHIEHVVRLAGVDHVCMGIDHGAIQFEIRGFEDCTKLPNLTEGLLDRGFTPAEVKKIMGENVLNFLDRHDRQSS
ncbi:dipeptidase [Chelatococcus sp. GCM10030263]|uniref:dipeptidase n=1 Tax=Chelatococcus sp. GCM10030263 TaxID=3273387 RepID=UPI00360F650B